MWTDDLIRAYLRGAVAAGFLRSWYHNRFMGAVSWIVSPVALECSRSLMPAAAVQYCEMLREAGVAPMERAV